MILVCFITAAAAANEKMYQYVELTEKDEESLGRVGQVGKQQQQYYEIQQTMFF